ncbi:MAG: tRNA preQ1(34) S-adenosylmethionine ribosyltransferase-isomerase QueA [Bradyrhizobiaceae bacterium]|nr:tRNA preQ1(34) S-adenosylmethionine ribosyltransferase-isomerase QueA [Bradyrhizobiaceae bacterium]
MRTDLFDFELPQDRIALRPASPRDSARLLVVRPGAEPSLEDRIVRDLPDLLQGGDQLVVNDTKVIPAQLCGRRAGGAGAPRIEATLIKRLDGARWQALVKPARKLKPGDKVRFGEDGNASEVCSLGGLDAIVERKGEAGEVILAFAFSGPVLDEAIAAHGSVPLPPYIAARRPPDAHDRADYQTMFARKEGAVAAPTAGLHFTESLLRDLAARRIGLHTVTLHVGAGTFLPVKAEDLAGHRMHAEWGQVSAEAATALSAAQGRIVAVGTTSLRLIESAAQDDGTIAPFCGDTTLFITPGYAFRAVDVLLTNFHLPRSTLFMLVAAFCGLSTMKRAYAHAVESGYRFYSYGDACLLFRNPA